MGFQELAFGGDRCRSTRPCSFKVFEEVQFLEVTMILVTPILGSHVNIDQLENEVSSPYSMPVATLKS